MTPVTIGQPRAQRGGVVQAGPLGCQVVGASISAFAFAAPGAR
jgi:hypothetical protein